MEVGVSTACFYPMNTEETVDEIIKTGAKNVEVFLEAKSEYDLNFCTELKCRFDDAGISVDSIHGFVAAYEHFLFSDYKRRAIDALNEYKQVIKAGKILGAKYNSFHGNRLEYYTDGFNFKEYAKVFDNLCDIANDSGLILTWENVSWCQSSKPDFISNSLEYIKSKKFGFVLDLKQAQRAKFNYYEYIKIYKNRLLNVHISDNTSENSCLLPGKGNHDFPSFLADLYECNYKGNLIIEVYKDAFTKTEEIGNSVSYLQNLIKNGEKTRKLNL